MRRERLDWVGSTKKWLQWDQHSHTEGETRTGLGRRVHCGIEKECMCHPHSPLKATSAPAGPFGGYSRSFCALGVSNAADAAVESEKNRMHG